MLTLRDDPTFQLYAGCCVTLTLLLMFLAAYTGVVRNRVKAHVNPEDARANGVEPAAVEHPAVAHVQRAHRNALENIPLFFALGLVCVLAGASPLGARLTFVGFTAARLLHAIFHLKGVQPWRSIVFGVGGLCLLGMMALIGAALAG